VALYQKKLPELYYVRVRYTEPAWQTCFCWAGSGAWYYPWHMLAFCMATPQNPLGVYRNAVAILRGAVKLRMYFGML
jgi:hypothetical protein